MKGELGGKIMTKFVAIRPKTYSYLLDDGSEDRKAKGTKTCVIKRELKSKNYEDCNKAAQLDNKIKNERQNEINADSLTK